MLCAAWEGRLYNPHVPVIVVTNWQIVLYYEKFAPAIELILVWKTCIDILKANKYYSAFTGAKWREPHEDHVL